MSDKYEILEQIFGYSSFRGGQETLIDAQLSGRDVFGIMPTGGGKSLCYQVPGLLLPGITLVVSPLISLMKDQVMALKKAGVAAAYINSSLTPDQIRLVYRNLIAGKYKIVYIAPERLLTEGFLATAQALTISLVAVDEAHCISQWGQDFRPSYLRIVEFLRHLPYRPVVSAFTATATPRVQEDVERILGLQNPLRVVTGFDRPNLYFSVEQPRGRPAHLLNLLEKRHGKSGIIYCSTRKTVENVHANLVEHGLPATRYHAGLTEEERRLNQEDFIYDRTPIMVATNAFGMGIDKSNVSYVIHYNMPQSMEAYYQEAGRAGRDGADADCILFFMTGDIQLAKRFVENPAENEYLSEEERQNVIAQGLVRLNKMIDYCKTKTCLRCYILEYFGQTPTGPCNNCGNCHMLVNGPAAVGQDVTTQAKMIFSCIRRIENHLGYNLRVPGVAKVLQGSRDKHLLAMGLDSLSTYGLMRDMPRSTLRALFLGLEKMGYLAIRSTYGEVSLTERADDVLFHGATVTLYTTTESESFTHNPRKFRAEADGLFDALRHLRSEIAREEGIPAYIIFSNATLQDMTSKAPTTMPEFLRINGVGRYKAQQYGKAFLDLIRRYRDGEYDD